MINHYQGNSGQVVRREEYRQERKAGPTVSAGEKSPVSAEKPGSPKLRQNMAGRGKNGLLEQLNQFLPGIKRGPEPETEDWILLLILYLMYRESGDKELLIILGVMLFL